MKRRFCTKTKIFIIIIIGVLFSSSFFLEMMDPAIYEILWLSLIFLVITILPDIIEDIICLIENMEEREEEKNENI